MTIKPVVKCDTNTSWNLAAAAAGTAIAWSYIDPGSALGYLSTLVSGVVGSQLTIQGARHARQNIGILCSRVSSEKFVDLEIVKSQLIYDKNSQNKGLVIAFCEIGPKDKRELVPLQKRYSSDEYSEYELFDPKCYEQGGVYTRFPGSYKQALLLMAQNANEDNFNLLELVLTHPGNKSGLTLDDFLNFLCRPDRSGCMRIRSGYMPIHTLSPTSSYEALTYIQNKQIKIDLTLVSASGQTLYEKCSKDSDYHLSSSIFEN